MRRLYDWTAIQCFHDEGRGFVECRKRFGVTHTAWNKAIKRGELRVAERPFHDRRRRYDWAAIQAYYNEGHSYFECRAVFGFCAAAWGKARTRGEITARPPGMPIARLLASNKRCRNHVKTRLIRAGLLANQCQICGLTSWQGTELRMHLDHINGIKDDHRLANLRMLCPNCHSQTATYGGRNIGRLRELQECPERM